MAIRSNGVSVKLHSVFGQMVFRSTGVRSKKIGKILFGKVIQNPPPTQIPTQNGEMKVLFKKFNRRKNLVVSV
jgi:hypothetical protein